MRQEEQQIAQDHPEDALDDRGTVDDPAVAGNRGADTADETDTGLGETRAYDARDAEADGRPYHDPGPLPTVFGATTVGDAVAASAMASGRPEDERDPRGEDTAVPGDGAPGRTEAFDDERADPAAGDRLHDPDRWEAEHSGAARDDAPEAGGAGFGSAEPEMVDPDASTAAVAAAETAGAAEAATLFAPEAAQGFRDRWREVQLRFVDDPRAAVGEAQSLVDEAMAALSAALREQKRKLGGWPESGTVDTEQVRVAVRGYRDFLDRVLGR